MTEKRFKVHIDWFNYEKTEGVAELKDNGQPLLISESVGDVRYLKGMLNNLHEENEQLKSEIEKLSYANEDLLSEKRNWQRMSDEYCKLSEENEKLKQVLKNKEELLNKTLQVNNNLQKELEKCQTH